jgi:Fe-S-cluster containining protein
MKGDSIPMYGTSAEMSLLEVCRCNGRCCVGRTLVSTAEREAIVEVARHDALVSWSANWNYLDRGSCPYLSDGRCSVQDVKPFVCRIYPFVPRVFDGEFWLVSVGECDAASRLSPTFIERARELAQTFFSNVRPEEYEVYWNANKIGDFEDARAVFKVRVFDGGPRL